MALLLQTVWSVLKSCIMSSVIVPFISRCDITIIYFEVVEVIQTPVTCISSSS